MNGTVVELIVRSLNVNDMIRATLWQVQHSTRAPRPEQGNSGVIQRRLHLWQTQFPTHPSCLQNLDIHYKVCRRMQARSYSAIHFFRPSLSLSSLSLPPSPLFQLPLFSPHSLFCFACVCVQYPCEWVSLVPSVRLWTERCWAAG